MYLQTRTIIEAVDLFCAQRQCYEQRKRNSRTLQEFENNPFLSLTIPLLKEIMAVPESELVDCIELAIIISEHEPYFFETLFHNIADKFDDDCNSLKYKTFTDFIVLLFEYNNESVNAITSEYEFRSGVFKEIELTEIPFEKIHIHDSVYEILLLDLTLTHNYLDLNVPIPINERYLSTYDLFLFDMLKIFQSFRFQVSYRKLYLDLFEKPGCIKSQFLDDKSISINDLLERKHNPIAFCFLVSYVKFKGLFSIPDNLILKSVSQNIINAFRTFWWLCDIWANNEKSFEPVYSLLNHSYSLRHYVYLTVENVSLRNYIRTNIQREDCCGNHIELNPSKDYLINCRKNNVVSTVSEVKRENADCFSLDNTEKNNENSLADYVNKDIDISKHAIVIETIRKYLVETKGKGKKTAVIVHAAYSSGIFMNKPSYESLLEIGLTGEDIGSRSGYYNQLQDHLYEGSTKDKTRINQYDSFCSIFTDLKQQLKKTETPA